MLKLLRTRADYLKKGKFQKAQEVADKMTKYKNDNLEDLVTPRFFYATFHHEYAYHLAIEVSKKNQFMFLNE